MRVINMNEDIKKDLEDIKSTLNELTKILFAIHLTLYEKRNWKKYHKKISC